MKNWQSHLHFILASAGAAIGLGTIWAAPFSIGEHGGGAFLLCYLLLTLILAFPLFHMEISLGLFSRCNIVDGFARLAAQQQCSHHWQNLGWASLLLLLAMLSFYCMIGGQVLSYFVTCSAKLTNITWPAKQHPLYSLGFALLTWLLCQDRWQVGIEKTANTLMPLFFLMLLILFVVTAQLPGMPTASHYLLYPQITAINHSALVSALGLALFTLATGTGCMMNYGAYLQSGSGIFLSNLSVLLMTLTTTLIAGLIVFAITFSYGLPAAGGPDLVFQTLPLAMQLFGPAATFMEWAFFLLLLIAALTSSISMLDPLLRTAREKKVLHPWLHGLGFIVLAGLLQSYHASATFFTSVRELLMQTLLPGMALAYIAFMLHSQIWQRLEPQALRLPLFVSLNLCGIAIIILLGGAWLI